MKYLMEYSMNQVEIAVDAFVEILFPLGGLIELTGVEIAPPYYTPMEHKVLWSRIVKPKCRSLDNTAMHKNNRIRIVFISQDDVHRIS